MEAEGKIASPSRPSKEGGQGEGEGGKSDAAKAAPQGGPQDSPPLPPPQQQQQQQQQPGTVVFHPAGCACGIHAMPSLFSMAALRKKKVPTDNETNKGRNTTADKLFANLSERDRFA